MGLLFVYAFWFIFKSTSRLKVVSTLAVAAGVTYCWAVSIGGNVTNFTATKTLRFRFIEKWFVGQWLALAPWL